MPIYGLLGYPLTHSFSKVYFTEKFLKEGREDCSYINLELKNISDLPEVLSGIQPAGFNVTIPYKEAILPFLNSLSTEAEKIGAVNTVVRDDDGKLMGYNTDYIGFKETLLPLLKSHHRAALILGSGGASKAVAMVLKDLGITYRIVSRSKTGSAFLRYEELNEDLISAHPLLINTTPLGTTPDIHLAPEIPYTALSAQHLLFDLVYNPATTMFMQKGIEKGSQVSNGYAMLICQAEAAWKIWNAKTNAS
ncbi:shikimate dehydrogenase [soil metagenome]